MVCVATEYGKLMQEHAPNTQTLSGRMDAGEMAKVLSGADLCIDATHPYAREASRNIRAAAKTANVPCRRLLRRESELPPDCILVDSAADAARGQRDGAEGAVKQPELLDRHSQPSGGTGILHEGDGDPAELRLRHPEEEEKTQQ